MRFSIFTPSHNPRYLNSAYESLVAQSVSDWEWIVLLNRKTPAWTPPADDPRVKVQRAPAAARGVGALKRAACELASGSILVELDHDDRLSRGCLAQLGEAFEDPAVVLAYSDFAQINADGSPNHDRFDPGYGWEYTQGTIDGQSYERCRALAPTPHNVGYIWYAPNHVRAFRHDTYVDVGGYDAGAEYLDDQELMSRLYLAGKFRQINRCLYFQRVHADNTQRERRINDAIQEQTVVYYREFIERLALAWAKRNGLRCLRLQTPIWLGEETDTDDLYERLVIDPDDPRIDADAGSVAVIRGWDVLQRLPKRAAFFNEAYRVLAHAGLLLTQTPSTDGRGAFQDPSAVAYYNENSFMYLTQDELRRTIPDLEARLQVSYLATSYPSEGHAERDIAYVEANLLAIKDGPRQGGPLLT
jgi:O-antigen biosynthesis protein